MLLSIEILPHTEARLRQQADAAGQDMPTFVSRLIERSAMKSDLDEILDPLRKHFAGMGIRDEELIDDITSAQGEYRADQHKKTA